MKKISMMIFALLILVSCTQDVNEISQPETEGVPVPISYSIAPMKVIGDAALATKATDPATVDENQISNLWIVQYNKVTGAFIKRYYTENVDKDAFIAHLSPTLSGNCNVYFVANAGASLPIAYTNNDFVNLTKDFTNEASVFVDGKVVSGASKLNIIMTGSLLNVTIPATGVMPTQNLELYRQLARVDVKYTITTDLDDKFVFETIKIGNVSTKMYYNSEGSPGATATSTTLVKSLDPVALTADQKSVGVHTITFYLPENKRGQSNAGNTDATTKGGIPDATFVEMVGHTKGAQGGEEVGYRLYPGLDVYDYNLVGNVKYLLELTFAGTSLMDQRVKMHDANCWMLRPGGTCNISVVRANRSDLGIQIPDVTKNWTAEVYWQTTPDMVSVDYTSTLSLGYFKVTAAAGKVGNALVVVRDANGKIVWSWHIWVLNDDMNFKTYQHNYSSGLTFMDRNLGATQTTTYNNNVSYEFIGGMLYQWGRKDPFIGTKIMTTTNANPAPLKLYKATGTTEFAPPAYSDVPGVATLTGDPYIRNSQSISITDKLSYSVRYPSLYIYNWLGSTAIDASTYAGRDSWGGEYNQPKTIYDPCPEGWRVPSAKRASTSVVHPWSGVSAYSHPSGTAADGSMCYVYTNGTPNVVAAYPVMGLRGSTGGFNSQTVAYVFSATAYDNFNAIFYYHSNSGTSTSTTSGLGKYYAGSIRCVKDWKLTY